jgi:hypothetical protein
MAPTAQKTDLFPAPPASPRPAGQFCGFYGAKVDTNAFNNASQVVLSEPDDKTITTKDFYRHVRSPGQESRYARGVYLIRLGLELV